MTQLDELYAKFDGEEAITARCRPELDALKIEIGPWLRAVASGIPMAEPVEARRRYADLQGELWQARALEQTRREVGLAENHSRRLREQITELNQEAARLEALPSSTPAGDARIAEEVTQLRRYAASYQITLDLIGTPRSQAQELVTA